jgi:hypothetical protein
MSDDQQAPRRRLTPRVAGVAGLLATGAIAGGILASNLTATAATTASTAPRAADAGAPRANAHGPDAVRAGEKVVTGSTAAKLKAAALKAVPGGAVYRVETDADGATYEAHMTKADGSEVTVKFDKSLNPTATQAGMGAGGPAHR